MVEPSWRVTCSVNREYAQYCRVHSGAHGYVLDARNGEDV
jgi:hypothetical protein